MSVYRTIGPLVCVIDGNIWFSSNLDHTSFNHFVPVNRTSVVMSCLENDMGKSRETVYCISFQRNFSPNLLKAHYDTNFTNRDKISTVCNA